MRVEILEKRLSTADPETGQHYSLTQGDVITVPDGLGSTWCGRGWAADVEGNVPTGERVVVGQIVQPHSSVHTNVTEGI